MTTTSLWSGRVLSGLAVIFLVFDGVTKFVLDKLPPEAIDPIKSLQWPLERMPMIGALLLLCVAIYLVPRTALVGAVLLTGYLGGAVASHVRVGNPLFTHTLVPVYVGVMLWLGLYLRDSRLRVALAKPK